MFKRLFCFLIVVFLIQSSYAQFLMDMVDTSTEMGKGILSIYKKFDNIKIGGYIQPQFQTAQQKGAPGYAGGDFLANANNRYILRRGRIRFDYVHFAENKNPSVQFVFQFDGTEKGVFIRDFWGRVFENKFQVFAFTAGMFARPFSYELNLSSSDRESPERGRMSQILMKTERDLGAMVTFEPRKKDNPLRYLKIDAGFFNGQGLTAPADYDSHKDFITRIGLKPCALSKIITFSIAASYLDGGFLQNTRYIYTTQNPGGAKNFVLDSSAKNIGGIAPRKYYGIDAQIKLKNKVGYTELRGEFIKGTQTATVNSTETPPALLSGSDGYYIRKFNGAYFYLLQNIFNRKNQLAFKFDWYDPNILVKGIDIGKTGTNINAANIKYTTVGMGYIWYINDNVKLVLWYDKITNEKTQLTGFTTDAKDDIFTCRLQFKF